jgi:CRISPR-associated exonuclease Cas4
MMEYNEEDFLMLSGIQHFAFCRRQWALIHIEQQWQENVRTVEGNILHESAHKDDFNERRGNVVITRGMPVYSRTLGINGVCDVVEFHADSSGVSIFEREGTYLPIPIEYKHGKPKEDDMDALQLCAQAMCIEEMMLCHIDAGYLYYGETRHRHRIEFKMSYVTG